MGARGQGEPRGNWIPDQVRNDDISICGVVRGGRWTDPFAEEHLPRSLLRCGGAHFRNWLEQFKQLGEVQVKEVDSIGFRCFEEAGEKLCRIWLKMNQSNWDDLS